ncbi:hypothetical protein CERSUDRAFT_84842 [Gelatoporia subvermispora B]|uniref:Zinc/iron permease n=1 Tax=Ceriporiopsis subvermispora (strain B) TaxID=914234 RepID=M2QUJ0_CERS8|nr:hypothetical protein CERSUDRAFT_84842 [Gelatoporia subvermispora B]
MSASYNLGSRSGPPRSTAAQKVVALQTDAEMMSRVWLMLIVFVVSLFAVSFPTLSKRIRYLRIPSIVFFIGKHFGTGVILSTAFVHLLQDAFETLRNPEVRERWRIGNWVGLLVLGSLLSIFCVEYISTAFVDRLHSYSSEPPSPTSVSPTSSPTISATQLPTQDIPPFGSLPSKAVDSPKDTPRAWEGVTRESAPGKPAPPPNSKTNDGTDHAAHAPLPLAPPERAQNVNEPSAYAHAEDGPSGHGHRQDETEPMTERTPLAGAVLAPTPVRSLGARASYGTASAARLASPTSGLDAALASRAYPATLPRRASAPDVRDETEEAVDIFSGGHHRHEGRAAHASHHTVGRGWKGWFGMDAGTQRRLREAVGDVDAEVVVVVNGGKTRSGKAKGSTSGRSAHGHEHGGHGHGHARGHSHGGQGHGHTHMDIEQWNGYDSEDEESVDEADPAVKVGRRRQIVGILMLQMGIMMHSLVIGLTLAIASGPEFTSLVAAIIFHQLFEGLSLGIRIAGLPSSSKDTGFSRISGRVLKPTLALSFAITVPVGITIGLAVFGAGRSEGGPKLKLIQGLMSAISAGMLIYAACVEMLAGDFVMDPHLWRSSVRRQILAIVSLFAGVAAMAAIGIVD